MRRIRANDQLRIHHSLNYTRILNKPVISGTTEKTEVRFCAKSGIERPLEGLCRCAVCVQKNESKWKENVDKWRVDDDKKKKKRRGTKSVKSQTKPVKRKKSFKTVSTKRFKASSLDDIVDDTPEGLPNGWKVITRFRGKREGKVKGRYKIYVSPCGSVCRSLVEVQNFLSDEKSPPIAKKKRKSRKQRETVMASTNSSGSASSSSPISQYRDDTEEEEPRSEARSKPDNNVAWFRVAIPKRAGGPGDKFRIRIPGKESILTSVIPENKAAGDLVYIDTSSVEQDLNSGLMMVMSYSEIPTDY